MCRRRLPKGYDQAYIAQIVSEVYSTHKALVNLQTALYKTYLDIPMARPNEPDITPKRIKRVREDISVHPVQFRSRDTSDMFNELILTSEHRAKHKLYRPKRAVRQIVTQFATVAGVKTIQNFQTISLFQAYS